MLACSALLLPFVMRGSSIGKKSGLAFLVLYAIYLGVLIMLAVHGGPSHPSR